MAERILVVGAGAVGGFLGVRLLEAGRDVTFLVRPARAKAIVDHGLTVSSPRSRVTVHPPTTTAAELSTPFDVILLSVKAFGLAEAIADIAPAVGPETMIVPTLNGIMHLEVLASEFGRSRVLGGVCVVASRVDAAGTIEQLNDGARLAYGELDGRISSRLTLVDTLFKDAGFDTHMSDSIESDMWEKWIFMASAGALTCLLRGNVGEIEAVPYGRSIAHSIVDEAVSFASAAGFEPRPEFVESVRQTLTLPGSSFTSSMYRDLIDGNRVEVESILGDLVARAEALGIASPILRLALTNLRIYARSLE